MKEVMKKLLGLTVVLSVGFLLGCTEDELTSGGKVNLKMKSSGTTSFNTGGRSTGRTSGVVEITDFQISIRDVVFKSDHDDDGISDDSTEISFRGPYQVDLLDGTDAITQTIGTVDVPNDVYQELRFKFHKDEDLPTTAPLFDKSIFIAGTIDGTPFEMWHDTSENLDVGKSTGVIVDNNEVNIVVNFAVDQFLNGAFNINLHDAKDGNEDGLIEINTNDSDGNKEIADQLKENIKDAADLLDE